MSSKQQQVQKQVWIPPDATPEELQLFIEATKAELIQMPRLGRILNQMRQEIYHDIIVPPAYMTRTGSSSIAPPKHSKCHELINKYFDHHGHLGNNRLITEYLRQFCPRRNAYFNSQLGLNPWGRGGVRLNPLGRGGY
jgi:hypothetical protein